MTRRALTFIFLALFLIGSGFIIYTGRPVMNVVSSEADFSTTSTTEPEGSFMFTMEIVSEHGVASDCWSAINGSVYDLSSWVSRHPGGPEAIMSLCGSDGSEMFNRQHGKAPKPQAMLGLLKIGILE